MSSLLRRKARLFLAVAAGATLTALIGVATSGPETASADRGERPDDGKVAKVEVFAPEDGYRAGLGCVGWFIDLAVDFEGVPLERTGFTGLQLTGPAAHNNTAPFPGTFSMGQDDRFQGLIVLVSTNGSGPGRNVANLFNLTGVTNRDDEEVQIWDTWIVGSTQFGCDTPSTVYAALAADKNGDGIYNDAPNAVPDSDADGDVDRGDLKAFGLASNVEKVDFFIRS